MTTRDEAWRSAIRIYLAGRFSDMTSDVAKLAVDRALEAIEISANLCTQPTDTLSAEQEMTTTKESPDSGAGALLPCPICHAQITLTHDTDYMARTYFHGHKKDCAIGILDSCILREKEKRFISSWNTRAQDAAGKGVDAPDLHVAICQAVALMNRTPSREQTFHEAHTILRQALMDYSPAKPAQVGEKYRAVTLSDVKAVMKHMLKTDGTNTTRRCMLAALQSIGAVVPAHTDSQATEHPWDAVGTRNPEYPETPPEA